MATTKRFRKAMLRVGDHHSPDGKVSITPQRLKHWQSEFARMNDAGLVVPMHWDHGSEIEMLTPVTMSDYQERKSRSAKNSVGKMTDFRLSSDGQSAEVEFEVTDENAAGKVGTDTVYVSPVILPDFRDGAGDSYSDVITHLDLVNYPVDHKQGPAEAVEDGALRCALRMGCDSTIYRLSSDLDDDSDEDDSEGSDNGSGVTVGSVLEKLTAIGLPLPEDTNGGNFLDRLNVALSVAIETNKDPDMSDKTNGSQDTQVEDPQARMMSLERQASAANAYAERMHRSQLLDRLDAAHDQGRCSQKQYAKRKAQIEAVKLSLSDDGKPERSTVEDFLEDLEDVPRGTYWDAETKAQRMSAEEPTKAVHFGTKGDEWTEDDEEALKRMTR